MVSKLDILKYTFRLAKLFSICILVGHTVFNFFFGKVLEESIQGTPAELDFKFIRGTAGSIAIFSGLANVHLVKIAKKNNIWFCIICMKFILALVLIPLFVREPLN